MRLLLDTHAFLWAAADPERLSVAARAAIEDPANELLLSVASLWEIALKVQAGKLTLPADASFLPRQMQALGLTALPIKMPHVLLVFTLPSVHRDPFDRMLAAQCLGEGLTLVSKDLALREYGVEWLW